jgi:membrane protein implicated in regulation of membrane protease activity
MQLFSLWFAAGALASVVASLFGADPWLQIVIFVTVTAVSLLATRPLVRRLQRGKSSEPTNADRYVGRRAVVLEEIDNVKGTGLIKVGGQVWSARSEDGFAVPAGESVQTVSIQGAKMLVSRPVPQSDA